MSDFWENELVEIAAYYSVAVLCLVLFLTVFELVTAYKNWEEIQKGNLAVAMATGGKFSLHVSWRLFIWNPSSQS